MRTKEVIINDEKYQIKELMYIDLVGLAEITNRQEHTFKLFELSGIPKEKTQTLNIQDGIKLTEAINELNGLGNFQQNTQA